jgi:hypothetical protein
MVGAEVKEGVRVLCVTGVDEGVKCGVCLVEEVTVSDHVRMSFGDSVVDVERPFVPDEEACEALEKVGTGPSRGVASEVTVSRSVLVGASITAVVQAGCGASRST